ncbi:helix-turn-helix transcriptional regulator [Staphylococcus simulans]|uniref:helix-turn-helix transcriptional regulator n=1 Tax=Staphylococcus simulans TaxID=1286 RepID=UPI002DBE0243|nr:helix-turn-helix transcriptional regulator [Staphylococcus simulans]MEB6838018.1 transcriptional regulator [Staphylococcus simulans]
MYLSDVEDCVKRVARVIKRERENKNISVQTVADELKISNSYYRHLERANTLHVSLYRHLHMVEVIDIPLSVVIESAEKAESTNDEFSLKDNKMKLATSYDKEAYIKEISKIFRRIRQDQGKKQKDVGKQLNSTSHYYGYIERGEHLAISLYKFFVIAHFFETPLYEILQEVEEKLSTQ